MWDLVGRYLGRSVINNRRGYQNSFLPVQKNILWKNVFCQKINLSFFEPWPMDFFWDLSFKNFTRVVRTAIYVMKGTVWEEELFLRKENKIDRYTFGTLAKSFRDMRRLFQSFFSEVYSSFTGEQFHESNFVEVNVYFIIFTSTAERFWTVQKFLKTVVNIWFYVYRGNFWDFSEMKIVWWKFSASDRIFSQLWQKRFAHFSKQNSGHPDEELQEKFF